MICPECAGTGENPNRPNQLQGKFRNNFNPVPTKLICEMCEGDGYISTQTILQTGYAVLYVRRDDGDGELVSTAHLAGELHFQIGFTPLDFLRIQAKTLELEGFDTQIAHFENLSGNKEILDDFDNHLVTCINFWDCDCEDNFIHLKTINSLTEVGMRDKCNLCGACEEEMPDSRVNEILRYYAPAD